MQKTLTAVALLLATWASPAALGVDTRQSKLTATFKQMGVSVEGAFTKVSGQVAFDPAQPAAAKAEITVDTTSFDIGDADYNAEVRKPEWFDSAKHPVARFTSTAFKPLGGNRYQATGKLALKGKSQDVSVAVTVENAAAATSFSGSLPISRKAFAIGDPAWEGTVDDSVSVAFRIVQPK
jgi:polyisoprenoid-binding protein YceI